MGEYHFLEIESLRDRRNYMPLLLDADPSQALVLTYLDQGRMFVMEDGAHTLGQVLFIPLGEGDWELKNIAVAPNFRKRGLGRALVLYGISRLEDCKKVYVGTGGNGVRFYQSCGFTYSHRVENFFVDNYPEPIYDDGVHLVDMIYLSRTP